MDTAEQLSPSLGAVGRLPRSMADDVHAALRLARAFNKHVVRPCYRELDARVEDDPAWLPAEVVREANAWGLFSAWIPKVFGGRGWNMLSLYFFLEEVSSVCVGIANVIGVHYLGVSTVTATWNTRLLRHICGEILAGERSGEPCIVSLAVTEPGAGTDMEETELIDRARLGTFARRVAGGYRLNGRKVFISNGHLSTWHAVLCFEDGRRAADTGVLLAVRSDTPGFGFGAKERKMGQRACVASELTFDDCFVPDDRVALDRLQWKACGSAMPMRDVLQQVLDYVVSSTRAGVGAFAAGVARVRMGELPPRPVSRPAARADGPRRPVRPADTPLDDHGAGPRP